MLLAGFLILSLLGITVVFLFDQLPRLLRYLTLPPDVQPMAEAQATNYFVYLWANWYAKHLYQGATILALLVGASLFAATAGDGPAGTAGGPRPGRGTIFAGKYLAGATGVALVMAGSTAVVGVVSILRGHPLPAANFALGLIPAMAGMLVIFGLAALCSALSPSPRQALLRAAATAVFLSVPGWIREWQDFSVYRQMQAMYYPFTGALFWDSIAGLLGAALLLALAAGWVFAGREA